MPAAQYSSIAFTERLATAGIDPTVGSVGDDYGNALAESLRCRDYLMIIL